MATTSRIERLRERALCPQICYEEFRFHYFYFLDAGGLEFGMDTYGDAYRYACEHVTPVIDEDELIVGKTVSALSAEQETLWREKFGRMAGSLKADAMGGQDSHMAIDYELVLTEGISGILGKIGTYKKNCCDDEKLTFYRCAEKCLQGVLILAERYAEHARRLAEVCTDKERGAELYKIAEICAKVPANPAETFYEAIQAAHFITYCISNDPIRQNLQYQLGRPDRYLYRFYANDVKRGILDNARARELFDCLGIQINHRVISGISSGYMVGGREADGTPVANELTYMGLEVISDLRLVYPSVGLSYNNDMPKELLRTACRILAQGCSHPAIFNDDLIAEGLMLYGVPKEDAHNYIHSTCVEITPIAASNVWVASPYTNLVQILLDIPDREYATFEELLGTYCDRLALVIKDHFEHENNIRKYRMENSMYPLVSCFVNDCLKEGKDIDRGGARYNWIMPSFVGMANLADSLYAIQKMIFERKELSFFELKKALDENFENNEALRLKLLNKVPKYGNDVDEVDLLFDRLIRFIVEECKKYQPVLPNSRLIPSVFCWIMHERFGAETGASPDGRKAGFPLGDGSGPCQGRERCGPTASVLSSTKWSHKELIGGVAVNMKFSKKAMSGQSLEKMLAIIQTYLDRGGFELQINVTDRETLLKAKENPEAYKDLVVRIGGYSDYFTRIPENMQNEVILRTEHEI